MVLIASTSPLIPTVAYTVLIPIYSYTCVILIAFFVASGLLHLRYFSDERHTWTNQAGFIPWGGPTAAIIYTAVSAFLLAATFNPTKIQFAVRQGEDRSGVVCRANCRVGDAAAGLGVLPSL